jgi:D-glycero-alpha-D-manno-heptose 1-phosphate guanylyltransferase
MIPAIVLAGGLGTRLRSVVPDLPKPMAPVAGKPFLEWLLLDLERQGVRDIFLSVGYKYEAIESYFGNTFGRARLHYIIEPEPLGTGGAIAHALQYIDGEAVFVLNGDTMAPIDLAELDCAAMDGDADLVMSVARLDDVARYGSVEFDDERTIRAFREKGERGAGYINAGTYWLRKQALVTRVERASFSFEQEFVQPHLSALRVQALPTVSQFIDIGVPDDFRLAQSVVPNLAAQIGTS